MPINQQGALTEIKEAEAHEYIDRVKETVVPHMKGTTGGIAGVKDPYPEITYRKFAGETLQEEKHLTDIKGKNPATQNAPTVPSLGGEPDLPPEEMEKTATVVKDATVIRAEAPQQPDINAGMMAMMQQMIDMQKQSTLQPRPLPEPRELKSTVISPNTEPPKGTPVSVTFLGGFGEVTAPFARVIDGDLCVALVQDKNNQFNYNPPVADDQPIQIEWDNRGQTREQRVIHAGLTFNLDGSTKVIVLLKA